MVWEYHAEENIDKIYLADSSWMVSSNKASF
jgi:hypothetical protein